MAASASAAVSRSTAGCMIGRMKRAGHGQRHGLHRAALRGQFGRPLDRPRSRPRPRYCPGRAGWRFPACRPRGLSATICFDLGPLQPQDADHAAGRGVGGVLHRGAALLHQAQAVFEIHHAGKDQRRVFAQAQSGRRFARQRHVGLGGPQRFQRGQAGDEQRRLAVDGRIELFGRPFEAELGQIVAQDFGRRGRTAARRRAATRPTAGPCRRFGPLARETERRSWSRFCPGCELRLPALSG